MTVKAENELERNHAAQRPSWDCEACLQPWPCANAKELLLNEFSGYPSVLTIYMSAQLCEAVLDLTAHGAEAPLDLFDRFMSWVHLASAGTGVPPQARSPQLQDRRNQSAPTTDEGPRRAAIRNDGPISAA